MKSKIYFPLFALFSVFLNATLVSAQVVYSLGVQELYDDNVFLEDDNRITPVVTDPAATPLPESALKQIDGDTNDDYITQVFMEASGSLPIPKYIEANASGKLGGLFFADLTDEDRLTVDTSLTLKATEDILPNKVSASLTSALSSGTNGVGTATGTAARTSEEHDATLSLGYGPIDLSSQTAANLGYTFNRHDFLGEFLFNKEKNLPEDSRFEEQGSDFISNSVSADIEHTLSQETSAGVNFGVTDYAFTSVESNSLDGGSGEDPDRLDFNASLYARHTASDELILNGQVGITNSHLKNDPAGRTIVVTNSDGTQTITTEQPDKDSTSLTFGFGLQYLPTPGTSLGANATQAVNTDIDGDRILNRTFSLNGSQDFGERVTFSASGLFTQYSSDSSVSDSSDRFEVNTGLTISLTEAISLGLGWNYATQEVDNLNQSVTFGTNDYDVNRAYISINAGFVGLTS